MNFQEFEQKIKDNDHRAIIILQLAMTVAAVMFPLMLIFVGSISGAERTGNTDFINILSMATAAVAFTSLSLFTILPKLRGKKETLQQIFTSEDSVNSFFVHFRSTRLLQLAQLEGSALLGGVCCFLALQEGVLPEQSVYWVNVAPSLIFLFASLATFPSKNHLYGQYRYLQELNSIN